MFSSPLPKMNCPRWNVARSVLVLMGCLLLGVPGAWAEGSDQGNLRIVLVGDSITGLSKNHPKGFARVMEEALREASPGREVEIVALGGSGQSVSSWVGIAERSQTQKTILDVKGVDANVELAKSADVLVVMLGMNDVLAPYVGNSEESLDRWIGTYEKLVSGLQARVRPKVLALAGITPYTEDPLSPENRLIAEMNQRVRALAEEMKGRYFETSEQAFEILRKGRSLDPEFHVTGDFVHANEAGNLAIAKAMLEGMGETAAAKWLLEEKLGPFWETTAGASAGISWERMAATREADGKNFAFQIRYDLSGKLAEAKARVEVVPPEGWKAVPATLTENSGEFRLIGNPDRLLNTFALRSGSTEVQGAVPAPWLVTAGVESKWDGETFDAAKNHTAIDDFIVGNHNVTLENDARGKMEWRPYFSSVNFTGGADPNSVAFMAITHAANFEAGYGVRWIYSEKERPIKVDLKSGVFAGSIHLVVWLNGGEVYEGLITKEPKKSTSVAAKLKKGWNALVFKSSHRTWLWQVSVGLAATEGDTLDDLRYSIIFPNSQ